MQSRITTKRGDRGETVALSGETYSKSHAVMACVGTLDELRAHAAWLRLRIREEQPRDADTLCDFLFWLLHMFFVLGTFCSDPLCKHPEYHKRALSPADLDKLEKEQERLESQIDLPAAFVVSASNSLAAQADVTCTVARRLEREFVRLVETIPGLPGDLPLAFLNRLGDYFFVLARFIESPKHETVDYHALD